MQCTCKLQLGYSSVIASNVKTSESTRLHLSMNEAKIHTAALLMNHHRMDAHQAIVAEVQETKGLCKPAIGGDKEQYQTPAMSWLVQRTMYMLRCFFRLLL
jgi:hypothetical protein